MDIMEIERFGINPSEVKEYINRVKNNSISVAITGEFNAGKSTFLNAFINKKDYLAYGDEECTPVLIELVNGNSSDIKITYNDTTVKSIPNTDENIKKVTTYREGYDKNILGVTLPIEGNYIKENMTLIDTPGTNTIIKQHEAITDYILKRVDIVVYMMNKVVGKSDIKRLNEIIKYTDNVIIVMTHMDEKVDEKWKNRNEEEIKRLVNIAKEQIVNENNKFEDIAIFPLGALAAYEEPNYLEKIRETINDYVNLNNKKVIKSRVEKQLKILFEDKINAFNADINTYEDEKINDIETIKDKIEKLNKNIEKNKSRNEKLLDEMNIDEKSIEVCKKKINSLFEYEENKTISKILSNKDMNEDEINSIIKEVLSNLGTCVRNIIETDANERINLIFNESNEKLTEIVNSIDINIDTNTYISIPNIEALEDREMLNRLEEIRMKSKKEAAEIAVTNVEIENINQININIKESTSEIKQRFNNLEIEKINHGIYKPEYEEAVEEGGGNSGALTGKIIGEVADIALIFFTPAKGATNAGKVVKAMDTFKDATKATKIVVDAAQKVNQSTKFVKEVAKKAAKTSKKTKILDKLKYLELSFYGEKIGKTLGETIKPTKTVLVENEALKFEHMERKQEIENNLRCERENLNKIQNQFEDNTISIGAYRRKKIEIENNLSCYKEEEERIIKNIEKQKTQTENEILSNYYKENIASIFEKESQETIDIVTGIIKNINERLLGESSILLEEKLISIKERLEYLTKNKNEIENKIKSDKEKLQELKKYETWITEWLD